MYVFYAQKEHFNLNCVDFLQTLIFELWLDFRLCALADGNQSISISDYGSCKIH